MSSDTLTWLLTKNTSSFLVKRNGNEFAREKFNLLNRNCRKYSGLAATKAVDVSIADKKVTLSTKIEKAAKKPVKAVNAVPSARAPAVVPTPSAPTSRATTTAAT